MSTINTRHCVQVAYTGSDGRPVRRVFASYVSPQRAQERALAFVSGAPRRVRYDLTHAR
jgi:hypothetical protein